MKDEDLESHFAVKINDECDLGIRGQEQEMAIALQIPSGGLFREEAAVSRPRFPL